MYLNPPKNTWASLIERNVPDDAAITESVRHIVAEVRTKGDAALRDFARKFDHTELSDLELSIDERTAADDAVKPEVKAAIQQAMHHIAAFHEAQRPRNVDIETQPGVRCYQRAVPLRRVGLYIPGGRAPLFSTVLMLALPARIAGCAEVVLCTPQGADGRIAPEIIHAANACGVHHIYRVGGAQAVAALAYGTESIPKVDKIFGPGNRYVTHAKQLVSADVSIDMPAGPSEVLVMADHTAVPAYVAADLLSQAEHGPDSQAILVSQTEEMARRVEAEVERQKALLPRKELVEGSLSHSRMIVLPTRREMIDFANAYAPEHLIISMAQPCEVAMKITAAGSIFLGNFSPESAGDYASGTNHTLPTGGWARSLAGVNLDSFYHKITLQQLTPGGLADLAPTITAMAEAEGLAAHAQAVRVRTERPAQAPAPSYSPKEEELFHVEAATRSLPCGQEREAELQKSLPFRPHLLSLEPYSTARDEYQGGDISVWLDANESPYDNGVNRYPDPHQRQLKARLSEIKGMPVKNIFVGNGSDEAIDLCFRLFCEPGQDNAVAIAPSYGMYAVAAAVNHVELREVELTADDFALPAGKLLAACDSRTKLLWVCSPNNPTGNAFALDELERLADRFGGVIVVDEAYADFSPKGSLLPRLSRHKNMVVLQTLSKAWGMAGMRLGLAFADEEIIEMMSRVKYPYNVNAPTQREVLRRLTDEPVAAHVEEICREREMLTRELALLPCVERVFPSDANFLLIRVKDAVRLYDVLVSHGIIVRNRSRLPLCHNCLRITIGTPAENQRLLAVLRAQDEVK